MRATLSWDEVERLTGGQLGRTVRTVCPFCSATRKRMNQRRPVFAVLLKEPDFAIFNCAHCGEQGYIHSNTSSHRVIDLAEIKRRKAEGERKERDHDQQRTARALKLWDERRPFVGSPAETYLRVTRGLGDWLEAFDLDQSLGFHPDCPFEGQRLPCMVALVRNIRTDEPQGIHRTALKLGPRPERIDRRSYAPIKGGAIKLSPDGDVTTGLLIGEGIETTLSASRALKFRPCWSVISKSGIEDFPVLGGLESVTIAVDRDRDGAGQRAADKCVERLTAAGIEVVTTHSPVGKDFNDMLVGSAR
jgi:Toprim domain-containing protein